MSQAKKALSRKNGRGAARASSQTKTYYNYIGGEWVRASSGEFFENFNPADTRDVVGRFPVSIPSWKLIPALVCGNTVVIKPAEDTPLSSINLVKACEEAGIPAGVVNIVTGYGETAGAAITANPDLRLISFTGSTETGRVV